MPVDKNGKYYLPWPYRQHESDKMVVMPFKQVTVGRVVEVMIAVSVPSESPEKVG